ncbi:hypothetical protein ACS0TY_034826 [Phlomoides rotata]
MVTLACIALALPNSSIGEGLRYVMIIDKILNKKESLTNMRMAADVLWVDVEVNRKWQDKDLK